jgi:hypothetical protein
MIPLLSQLARHHLHNPAEAVGHLAETARRERHGKWHLYLHLTDFGQRGEFPFG